MAQRPSDFQQFRASELFCKTCGRATPVREHLLLVLPTGNEYDYRCSVCGTVVGSKTDQRAEDFSILTRR